MSIKVKVGDIFIGGGAPVSVQTMSVIRPKEVKKAVAEARALKSLGCDILRYAVLDEEDARSFSAIKKEVGLPLVADIHYDYKLALLSIDGGADKIRINPGNIGGEKNVRFVAEALKERGIPVRVGANAGSLEKEFEEKYGRTEVALAESALKQVSILEKYGVNNVVVSVKSSDVSLMVKAYEYIAQKTDYPLHLGVTEAGTKLSGTVKNAIGIGSLLLKGIGDTIRVSLSAPIEEEVRAGREILSALGLKKGVRIVACPTCGRCMWDCMKFAEKTEEFTKNIDRDVKIAVMGCAVNGVGEGKDADLGIAGAGNGECVIFRNGRILKKVSEKDAEREFFGEIERCCRI